MLLNSWRTLGVVFAAIVLSCVFAGPASAQDSEAQADEQARAYFRTGAFEDAAEEFAKAYQISPKPKYLYNAGLAFEKAGLKKKASEYFDKFLAVEPDGAKAVEARARKAALDKTAGIEELATQADKAMASGDFAASAQALKQAYEASNDPRFVFDLAEALRMGGNKAEALSAYRKYQRLAPGGAYLDEAQRQQSLITASQEKARDPGGQTSGSGRKTVAVGFGVLGVIAFGTGGYFGLDAIDLRDQARDGDGACSADFSECGQEGFARFKEAQTSSGRASIAFGLGALASGAGLILWLTAADAPERATATHVLPVVGDDNIGFVLGGRY